VGSHLNTQLGRQNEAKAVQFLLDQGFEVLDRNYYAKKLGELDIVAQHEGVLHFVEVKSAKADFDPIYNFTPSKLRKVINTAHFYLKTHQLDLPFSIDLLVIRQEEIEFIENVTL